MKSYNFNGVKVEVESHSGFDTLHIGGKNQFNTEPVLTQFADGRISGTVYGGIDAVRKAFPNLKVTEQFDGTFDVRSA